jgi:hypothetical protein
MEVGSSTTLVPMYQTNYMCHIANDCIFTWVFMFLSIEDAIHILAFQVQPLYIKCNSIKSKEINIFLHLVLCFYAMYIGTEVKLWTWDLQNEK